MDIKQKIGSRLNVPGGYLFHITGFFTLIYWAIIVTQIVAGKDSASVPPQMFGFYITLLGAYMGVNQIDRACSDEKKPRNGQLFFYGWLILMAISTVLVAFRVYGNEETLDILWPYPLSPIIGIFLGTQVLKNAKKIIKEVREAFSKSPSSSEPSSK